MKLVAIRQFVNIHNEFEEGMNRLTNLEDFENKFARISD